MKKGKLALIIIVTVVVVALVTVAILFATGVFDGQIIGTTR